MQIEIRIVNSRGEFAVVKKVVLDKYGRPTMTQAEVLASAVADARSWLNRNNQEVEPRR